MLPTNYSLYTMDDHVQYKGKLRLKFTNKEVYALIDEVIYEHEHSGLKFMNYGTIYNHEGKQLGKHIPPEQYRRNSIKTVKNKQKANPDKHIRITDLINENFYEFWNKYRENIYGYVLKGGRSSLKSSAASLRLVKDMIEDPLANIVCFRKVAAYLRTSVYSQIAWALSMLNIEQEFTFYKSPLMIEHNETKTAFYFYGVDDPQKIKSTKINNGYVKSIWFEEAAEFASHEEIDMVADTFIRQQIYDKDGNEVPVKQYFTYNPPRNPYEWINEWVEQMQKNPKWYIHHSTYEEDTKGFLSKQFLEKVALIKQNDPSYHDWMYLGKVVGYSDNIYNFDLFHVIDKLPENDRIIMLDIAIDTGYSVSATTYLLIAKTLKNNIILLDTYYYSPENQAIKKAPSDFSKDLNDFTKNNRAIYNYPLDTQVSDSADGALRNEYMKQYGIYLTPAKKKKKINMIENVETLLAQGRVYVLNTKNNQIFLEEHKRYQWDPDTKDTDDPKVIKENDHTCDAFQYYVNNNLAKLGLKF